MSIFEAIILGIVQGLTEFIPVSSSGHLFLFQYAFGLEQNGLTFDIALHVGTLAALLTYFRKDIIWLLRLSVRRDEGGRLPWLIGAATIPAAVAGYLLEDSAESTFRSPWLVAFNLAFFGAIMLVADWFSRHKATVKTAAVEKVSPRQALAVGLAQAAAIVPGVSRSGSTITAGLFVGLTHKTAARFSFLLGIPIMSGAALKVLTSADSFTSITEQKMLFAVGMTVAFIMGLLAIRFMLNYLAKHTLKVFVYYRFAVAAITVIALLIG